MQKSINRNIDFCLKTMGIVHQTFYVIDIVSRSCTGTESRPAYIHSISTVTYSLDANVCITGRSQKFERCLIQCRLY